jgi:hypothetical protein
MDNDKLKISEVCSVYKEVFGTECTDVEAEVFRNQFESILRLNKTIDDCNLKYVIPCNSLLDFFESKRARQEQLLAQSEYQKKLMEMPAHIRWLHQEGLGDEFGLKVQELLADNEECNVVYRKVVSLGFTYESDDLILDIIETFSPLLSELNVMCIESFMSSKKCKGLMTWFQGIVGDGGRAWRTIHFCLRSFKEHCQEICKDG